MKNYIVTLNLILGEYEKISRILVEAEDKERAGIAALKAESHDNEDGFDEDGYWWDCGWGYVYKVYWVEEVEDQSEWEVLEKYF